MAEAQAPFHSIDRLKKDSMSFSFVSKRFLLLFTLAAAVVFGLIKFSERQPVARVTAVTPTRENLSSSISSNGKVEAISPYQIRAQLSTFIERIYVVEGQQVKKGEPLMSLDVTDARAQLARARAELAAAQDELRAAKSGGRPDDVARINADLSKAQAEYDRLQKEHDSIVRLIAKQAATQEELARNQMALRTAQADVSRLSASKKEFERRVTLDAGQSGLRVEQARSEVRSLEEKVRSAQVTAPAEATLYSLPVRAGDFVKVGDPLAEMADLHQVRVRAFIDEPELGALEPNQNVLITWDALPNRTWRGKTVLVPKQVVARGTRSVGELLCSVDNSNLELIPNVNVNVRINSRERLGVLSLPRGAVQIDGSHRYVYVIKDPALGVNRSHLERREIRVGIASATNYEILSGVNEGETVALPGDIELKDGMAVQVLRTE
ncbi:MAG TPA: efflux RND transporter periplasmic adaptor subunit [Candidatus Dormibacteraeota bacterium]|nr:efflux RND transporter periplasmic adaptor subunit [Candidatus Dormibacteraeota bacterium]